MHWLIVCSQEQWKCELLKAWEQNISQKIVFWSSTNLMPVKQIILYRLKSPPESPDRTSLHSNLRNMLGFDCSILPWKQIWLDFLHSIVNVFLAQHMYNYILMYMSICFQIMISLKINETNFVNVLYVFISWAEMKT